MNKLILAVSLTLVSCGARWADCQDCSVDPAAGTPPPVAATVIVVDVDNDVTVVVNTTIAIQVEEDNGDGSCAVCAPPVDAGVCDAGTVSTPDSGTVVDSGTPDSGYDAGHDAGIPPGCTCKKVCTEYKRIHTGHTYATCHDKTKDTLVCVKTVLDCVKG